MFDFTGQTIIITGGSRGIGFAASKMFLEAGGRVYSLDISEENNRIAQEKLSGYPFHVRTCDVSNHDNVTEILEGIIEEAGQVHVLVNVAGASSPKPFWELDKAMWDRIIGISLTGTFSTCHVMFKHFKEHNYGRIVNISSVAGKRGGGVLGTTFYAAAKAGVLGLTKGLAREGGPFGITSNAICPCLVKAEIVNQSIESEEVAQRIENFIKMNMPVGRWGESEDIARGIVFLAAKESSFITGEMMDIDGGLMMD